MRFIADFHIHSKFSRATSQEMDIDHLSRSAQGKGIDLLGTGDFTHPGWLLELKERLTPLGNGLYKQDKTHFILTAEVSNIFFKDGRSRKIHNIIFAPSLEAAERINRGLAKFGDLEIDGRPMLNLAAKDLLELVLGVSSECLVIPGHIWTPWFSLFGSNSGFDTLEECFEEYSPHIYALETGLSSDPKMNWRLSGLDRYSLVSNSDAHSPGKIGREANILEGEPNYNEIVRILKEKDRKGFLLTCEFYPEEGKYHYDGHRRCKIVFSPKESRSKQNICPVCGKMLTIGVMHRVEELADRPEDYSPNDVIPFRHLVPLEEIISEAIGKGVGTVAVKTEYQRLIQHFGSEFKIILEFDEEELKEVTPSRILKGIMQVRQGRVNIQPGYDGEYGKVNIFDKEAEEGGQLSLF